MAKLKESSLAYSAGTSSKRITNAKAAALALLDRLPDDVSYEDIMYQLYVLDKISKGISELDHGKSLTHANVRKNLRQWLK
ncbi:MAG TPA: hypothetical protein VKS81_09565 [Bacteroidota bacterium]|nr:hypothetical protein [Bacteroidota bacterium]